MLFMGIDISNRRICQRVHPVTRQGHFLILIIIHHGMISSRCVFQGIGAQPVLVPSPLFLRYGAAARTQMPLADITRIISRRIEIIRHGLMGTAQYPGIAICSYRRSVFSGLQNSAGRTTDWLWCECLVDMRSLHCHLIEVWRQHAWISMNACGIPPLLIRKEDDYIHFHSPLI